MFSTDSIIQDSMGNRKTVRTVSEIKNRILLFNKCRNITFAVALVAPMPEGFTIDIGLQSQSQAP